MNDTLSISAAARDRGDAAALRLDGRTWTFAELAALATKRMDALAPRLVPHRPFPLVGTNTLDTVLSILALWELGAATLLIHPKLTRHERAALLVNADQNGRMDAPEAAAVLYTSGTTGIPRAAILSRRAFLTSAVANAANIGWHDDDCWLLCMPLAHVGGLSILSRCLIARQCVALTTGFDVSQVASIIEQQRVTLVSLVPTMLARLLDAGWRAPSALRAVLLGGAHASARLLARAVDRKVPVLVTYGLTETCSQVTTTPYRARHDPRACGAGTPLPGIGIRVRDDHIEVHGPVLMDGYWSEPRLPKNAWFATGDIGSIDANGCLHVHARRNDVIVTGGENVYPLEVENALEACPGVLGAGVFGIQDELWGQTVAAAVVIDPAVVTKARLRDFVQAHLAAHKQPRHLVFVRELPYTRAGKLDRGALPALAQSDQVLLRL